MLLNRLVLNGKGLIRLSVCLILIIAAIGLFLSQRPPSEPTYADKPLSEWVENLARPESLQEKEKAEAALRHIGTNALPHLMQWLQYVPTEDHYWTPLVMDHYHEFTDEGRRQWRKYNQGAIRSFGAVQGFRVLGAQASNAIPDLLQRAKPPVHNLAVLNATRALASIGPMTLPSLMEVLTNAPPSKCYDVMLAVRNLGTNARPVIPFFLQQLKSDNEMLASTAAHSLAAFQPDLSLAIPALTNALKHPRPRVRISVVLSISALGSNAISALPALIGCLNDESGFVAWDAAKALGRLKLAPSLVVPALTNALQNTNQLFRQFLLKAIEEYRAEAWSALPALLMCLDDPRVASTAAYTISGLKFGTEIFPEITLRLQSTNSSTRSAAAHVFSSYRQAARPAVPLLLKALSDTNEYVRTSAYYALRQIAPETVPNPPPQ